MTAPRLNDDSEAIYDAEVYPLMAQIIEVCKQHRIPMIATFQLTSEDDPLMCSSRVRFVGEDRRLAKAMRVINPLPARLVALTVTTCPPRKR